MRTTVICHILFAYYSSQLCLNSENVHCSHLSSLCGCSKAGVDSIKFPNSHHARVNLVVQLKGEYGDQHVACCVSLIRQEPRQEEYEATHSKYVI